MSSSLGVAIGKSIRKSVSSPVSGKEAIQEFLSKIGLIYYAPISNGMIDTIGLSAAALWAALPATHRSIYLVDENTLRSAEAIITNIEASDYLNDGGELVGSEAKGYAQYEAGTSEAVLRRAYRYFGVEFPTLADAWNDAAIWNDANIWSDGL